MSQTILITGSSTGIGQAAAIYFRQQGWNVAATMRTPEKAGDWAQGMFLTRLDVLDNDSIRQAITATRGKFGRIDAVCNNAGYGLVGPFEASTQEQIERQFGTNVFGLMNVIREILPLFREQNGGAIINVASVGGRIAFPLYSLYHGTKWAVEGFSEGLHYELKQFNIRVKIVEPGPIKTDFYDRSIEIMQKPGLAAYDNFVNNAMPGLNQAGANAPGPELVAKVIYRAATDGSWRIRYPANALPLLIARRLLPDWAYHRMVKMALGVK
jgi:NAD(P)-dependent dehydrogenase (short-subunit alcohol dehydrogenase family)